LLHVVDAASPNFLEQIAEVQRVLGEIGAADIRRSWYSTSSTPLKRAPPLQLEDTFDLDGVPIPRIFLSAKMVKAFSVAPSISAHREWGVLPARMISIP